MSSDRKGLPNSDETEDVSTSPQPTGAVALPHSSIPQSLAVPSLPTISISPPLPPRYPTRSSTPSVPQPQGQLRSSNSALPPFSPLSPLPASLTPSLQTDPLVTPNSSPARHSSVISCPSSCDNTHYHQTPVNSLQPDHLRPSRRLGSALIQKYFSKIPVVSTSVSSLEPDYLEPAAVPVFGVHSSRSD